MSFEANNKTDLGIPIVVGIGNVCVRVEDGPMATWKALRFIKRSNWFGSEPPATIPRPYIDRAYDSLAGPLSIYETPVLMSVVMANSCTAEPQSVDIHPDDSSPMPRSVAPPLTNAVIASGPRMGESV